IEEGRYFSRKDFSGHIVQMTDRLYRNKGATFAFSPWPVFLPLGKSVGGTTTINSGTCFPPTPWVYEYWKSLGLPMLSEEELAPHLEEVARLFKISPATDETIGPVGEIIRAGAEKLGLKDVHALSRNAESCDGQALCQFGCPTGAKQSTDVSMVPRALERGAFLFTGFAARRLLWENGAVAGVVSRGRDASGRPRTLTIRAKNVVVSMGALLTPVFLARNNVTHPQLGKNLTFHPATGVGGIFPDTDMKNQASIPQGIGIGDLADRGIRLEGGTLPFVPYGMSIRRSGKRFVHLMENWSHTAFFGFMARDRGRGRVWTKTPGNFPLVTYRLHDDDFAGFLQAMELMMRLFLTEGASEVFSLGSPGLPPVRSLDELSRFMKRKFHKRDFFLSAWHPLGTAQVAPTPEAGVCGPDHQVWGKKGLYVMDGAAVPGPLGVNPQVTIAALSLRAASLLADRLDREAL
ncbi:MAG: GMC family oxidoreductase N-terminal domain-containing protein, partial [Proteobacteria bacterium]|nr:GMC family oxidoreductase N-terminal domain-containing protein [Pseudomonadota bacterium]